MDTAAMRHAQGHELVLERRYAAPADLLFEVWSQPKHVVNWWGPHEFTVPFCDLNFSVGGGYRICMRSPDGEDHWVHGEYLEIDEPERITFTWKRENPDGSVWCDTRVTVTFTAVGEETEFRLRQVGFETAAVRDEHHGGWSECLERLGSYVEVE